MLPEPTRQRLRARLAQEQRERRLPSVVAGLVRDGAMVWWDSVGEVGDAAPGADTQYRIGSITKTFTAVCVLRLRDEGLVELDAPIDRYVADAPAGVTVAQVLSHAAGLQAETDGPWWERTPGGGWAELAGSLTADVARHPPGERFHYSNVGYAALGELVARLRAAPWADVVRDELLTPLGMDRTTPRPVAPFAPGLAVHPWADAVLAEPEHDAGAMAPAGQLWSSITDLARWAAVLAGHTGDLLAAGTLDEMARPRVIVDDPEQPWTAAYGLGVQVWNADGRRAMGHGGSMPGHLAFVRVDRTTGDGVVLATNTTTGIDVAVIGDLLRILAEDVPRAVAEPWRPTSIPGDLVDVLGAWYWGPSPFLLRVTGPDELTLEPMAGQGRRSRFHRGAGDGVAWVGRDGYYAGEPLTIVRDADGRASHLDLASFVFTRAPYAPDAEVPGGVDPAGWHAP